MTVVIPKILIVDDEEWNLKVFESYLRPQQYDILTARSGEEALQRIREARPDLILLDVMMPGKDGFEVCREIKHKMLLQSVPVILVSALRETVDKVHGLEAGADDFLSKPIDGSELIARVHAHLRLKFLMDEMQLWNQTLEQRVQERTRIIHEKTRQLNESYFQTVEALITALDTRERETGKHSLRVAFYTTELTKASGIKGRELEEIAMGSLLHDIGKIGIPDQILKKPTVLTEMEWMEMKKHPAIGWNMIKDIDFIGIGRELVLSHQERYNGEGYPRKLQGDQIFIGARFFAVMDTFDALTSNRPYKMAIPFEESVKLLQEESGKRLDPEAVSLFFSIPRKRWDELKEIVNTSNFRSLIQQIRTS
ncbi:MAG: response regulator [Candidatus Omnitrophica bacterium]|nr:response regulator [Candidatus Omnitrophota bacterium]